MLEKIKQRLRDVSSILIEHEEVGYADLIRE